MNTRSGCWERGVGFKGYIWWLGVLTFGSGVIATSCFPSILKVVVPASSPSTALAISGGSPLLRSAPLQRRGASLGTATHVVGTPVGV